MTGIVRRLPLKWNHDKPKSDARRSVLKQWKDKAFAGGVNRAVIEKGAALMGLPLDELIADTIEGMKPVAEIIGLKGNL